MEREELIRAIGEPMRLRILELLTQRQYCVRSLARMLGISEPAVSQHLRVMREAGLVTVEKLGYHSHYRLVPEALEQLGEQFMQLAEAAQKAPMEETGHGCGRRHMLAAEMGEPGFRKRCHGHEPEEHRPHGKCRRPEKPEGCPGPEACECHTHKEMEE